MKKTFKDLAPDEKQLKSINRFAPGELEKEDVGVIPMLVIGQAETSYHTRADVTWINQAAKDINGDEGVSLQKNHDTSELPMGRLFAADIGENENGKTLNALAFTRSAEFGEKYLSGEVQAVSAGLNYSWLKCSVCGNKWFSDECMEAAKKSKIQSDEGRVYHWPGQVYAGEKCVLDMMIDEGDSALREVSPVYKGGSEGRLGTLADVAKISQKLFADATSQLFEGEKLPEHPELMKKAADGYAKNLKTLEFPVFHKDCEGTKEENPENPETTLLEKQSANHAKTLAKKETKIKKLKEEKDALKAELAQSTKDVDTERQLKSAAETNLTEIAEALAGASTSSATGESDDEKELSFSEQIEQLGVLAKLGTELRELLSKKIETLDIKLKGNEAAKAESFLKLGAAELVKEIEIREAEIAEVTNTEALTQTQTKKKSGRNKPASAFKF